MAQKWSWKSLTYLQICIFDFLVKKLVKWQCLHGVIQWFEEFSSAYRKTDFDEKFQNFRHKSHLCKVNFGELQCATRKTIRILLLRNFFKWTKLKNIAGISFWISNWERFVTNIRPHAPSMDFYKTAGPVEQCALVGRAHPLQFLQIQTTEEPNNRN